MSSSIVGKTVEIKLDGVTYTSGKIISLEDVSTDEGSSTSLVKVLIEDENGREFIEELMIPNNLYYEV
jgi:hypothetical protein